MISVPELPLLLLPCRCRTLCRSAAAQGANGAPSSEPGWICREPGSSLHIWIPSRWPWVRPITLPWQPFKQCVPTSPFSPVLHAPGPSEILAFAGLQAACQQPCQAAWGARAFQRAPTAACYLIVLHKSSCFVWTALQSCLMASFVSCVCCRGAVLRLALQGWSILDLEACVFWDWKANKQNNIEINSCSRAYLSVRNSFLYRECNILWV